MKSRALIPQKPNPEQMGQRRASAPRGGMRVGTGRFVAAFGLSVACTSLEVERDLLTRHLAGPRT